MGEQERAGACAPDKFGQSKSSRRWSRRQGGLRGRALRWGLHCRSPQPEVRPSLRPDGRGGAQARPARPVAGDESCCGRRCDREEARWCDCRRVEYCELEVGRGVACAEVGCKRPRWGDVLHMELEGDGNCTCFTVRGGEAWEWFCPEEGRGRKEGGRRDFCHIPVCVLLLILSVQSSHEYDRIGDRGGLHGLIKPIPAVRMPIAPRRTEQRNVRVTGEQLS